jgi:chromosome segregation ATPase
LRSTSTSACQASFATASTNLQKEQAALASFDNELADLERDIKHTRQEISDAELAIKAAEHELQQHITDQKRWAKKVEDLEHQFPWIRDEKRFVVSLGSASSSRIC